MDFVCKQCYLEVLDEMNINDLCDKCNEKLELIKDLKQHGNVFLINENKIIQLPIISNIKYIQLDNYSNTEIINLLDDYIVDSHKSIIFDSNVVIIDLEPVNYG